MKTRYLVFLAVCLFTGVKAQQVNPKDSTWTADNGNGTFTNPLFFDEFSDPDLIRVGRDYYLTGTTMHAMPGLPVLHSKDLVNWKFLSYASDKLDLGPEFRLAGGKNVYGQGIWAPSFRYYKGKFYIFSNVNHHHTQVFSAANPAGPWKHGELKCSLHDLSVLFDDDGKAYVVWGYNEIRLAQLNKQLTDTVAGTTKIIIPKGRGMGEGSHFYKIHGKYYIFSANYDPVLYMVCARADKLTGPFEITVVSANEDLGMEPGWRIKGNNKQSPFTLTPPAVGGQPGHMSMHQGGVVQTPSGEWWGFSMMEYNAVGRLTCLSPVTWENGWPYFGLPGNLKRSPRTWVKPNTGFVSMPSAPYERSDDFSGNKLKPIWQWNHVPDDEQWSLTEKKGSLRLHSLPAKNFWEARNSLTQRAIGPESIPTVEVDASGMQTGDIAGLALLNLPYASIGVAKSSEGLTIRQYDQITGKTETATTHSTHLWLRAHCNFDTEKATFSFSADNINYQQLGDEFTMVFQLTTFQGVRYALFNYNTNGVAGGYADFTNFRLDEPRPHGLTRPIPFGKTIRLTSLGDNTTLVVWNGLLRPVPASNPLASSPSSQFKVIDKGLGRIALQAKDGNGYISVMDDGGMGDVRLVKTEDGDRTTFQWQDMLQDGSLMLMSLATHRYLFVKPGNGSLAYSNSPGASPGRKGGSCFSWKVVSE